MSRDESGRAELRRMDAAAPGGLTADDARRALEVLRRGGLAVIRFWVPDGGEQHMLATAVGPDLGDAEFSRLYLAWHAANGELADRCCRVRDRADVDARATGDPLERSLLSAAAGRRIAELWKARHLAEGATFAEHLALRCGFLVLTPDRHVLLPAHPNPRRERAL